ncbi:SEC24-RELATED PROTEIN [Salix viminalis]|uniref:SEC24-RELATED PROTEIN n=1 Tax=Salix viminalis TaxID=40686 RepID=A0A9Q0ZDM1_SALVM|nr:SEC24-RELATED PROTEIN [Salix viminalis]
MPSVSGSMPGGPRFPLVSSTPTIYGISTNCSSSCSCPGPPFGAQTWSLQPQQPPTKFGMPPHLANQGMMAISPAMGQNGASLAGQPKMDSKSVPSPTPTSESIYHETRRTIRLTLLPLLQDLAHENGCGLWGNWSREVFSLQSLLEHPLENYLKKLLKLDSAKRPRNYSYSMVIALKDIDLEERFADETPSDYQCNLGPDGRRRDADERPKLCRGTVKFVASKEYIHGKDGTRREE